MGCHKPPRPQKAPRVPDVPLNQKGTQRPTKCPLATGQAQLDILSDSGDCFESKYSLRTKPWYAGELRGFFLLVIKLLSPAR